MSTATIPRIQPILFDGGKGQPYLTPLGELPSVTTILRETQPEETRKKLEQWRRANPKNNAAERGTLVHQAIEDLLTGRPARCLNPWWVSISQLLHSSPRFSPS